MDFNEPAFDDSEEPEFTFDSSDETIINRDALLMPQGGEAYI